MEEDEQDHKPTASAFFRHRSPTFSKEEVKTLLNIVQRYKTTVFNKSTSAAASYAKEAAWIKIAKVFNSQGFAHVRSADCLKIKWDNLKKEARKSSKNLIDLKYNENDDITNQMVAMMYEAENNTNSVEEPLGSDGDINDTMEHKETSDIHWNSTAEKNYEDLLDGDENERFPSDPVKKMWTEATGRIELIPTKCITICPKHFIENNYITKKLGKRYLKLRKKILKISLCLFSKLVNRSLNFTPKECNLLLQCVRREKNIILSKTNTTKANKIKSRAWSRITNSYNKLSPQKRTTKMLRTKFTNMKRLAKSVCLKDYIKDFGKKHHKLEDSGDSKKTIKSEPVFETYSNQVDDIDDGEDIHELDSEQNNNFNSTVDPLRTVLNSDFTIGSCNDNENKEIVKLKTDLLNYEMETAKLQRKRIEDLIQADAVEREAKAIETSLRLRAARLEAIAAEMKFPQTHPGLAYTVEESRAQHYIHQYHTT